MSSFLPTIKSRVFQDGPPISYKTGIGGVWVQRPVVYPSTSETIISQCHTGDWDRKRGPSGAPLGNLTDGDVGGFMRLERLSRTYSSVVVNTPATRGRVTFGQLYGIVSDGLDDVVSTQTSVLDAFGTSAIAKVLPNNPNFSLATALGELRQDGLPRLPGADLKERVGLARSAGSEYLNVEFGWLPLLADLQGFADSVKNSRALIDQYARDSDRKIRRRYVAPRLVSTNTREGAGQCLGSGLTGYGSVTGTLSTDTWFSGAFRYHVPVDDGFYGRLRRYESLANHLFGTRVTPETLWNLAPWSWAVDWFTNFGDVIHNIVGLGSDSMVMQYGYVMRHSRKLSQWRITTPYTGTVGRDDLHELKYRNRANPYGFGIDDTTLNRAQLAILAALGLSRGKRNT